MNTSVAAYTPKGKICVTTNSLLSRVSIVTGIQILSYDQFWKEVAPSFEFELDPNRIAVLQANDNNKDKRRAVTAIMDGKKRQSKYKNEKLNNVHKTQLDGFKKEMYYETGVAVATNKRELKKSIKVLLELFQVCVIIYITAPSSVLYLATRNVGAKSE